MKVVGGRTHSQLLLSDNDDSPSPSTMPSLPSKATKLRAGGQPLLVDMCSGAFVDGLKRFPHRILMCNAFGDASVHYSTSAILPRNPYRRLPSSLTVDLLPRRKECSRLLDRERALSLIAAAREEEQKQDSAAAMADDEVAPTSSSSSAMSAVATVFSLARRATSAVYHAVGGAPHAHQNATNTEEKNEQEDNQDGTHLERGDTEDDALVSDVSLASSSFLQLPHLQKMYAQLSQLKWERYDIVGRSLLAHTDVVVKRERLNHAGVELVLFAVSLLRLKGKQLV